MFFYSVKKFVESVEFVEFLEFCHLTACLPRRVPEVNLDKPKNSTNSAIKRRRLRG